MEFALDDPDSDRVMFPLASHFVCSSRANRRRNQGLPSQTLPGTKQVLDGLYDITVTPWPTGGTISVEGRLSPLNPFGARALQNAPGSPTIYDGDFEAACGA